MNTNKNCAQEIRPVKVPQLAISPNWPLPRAKIPKLPVNRIIRHDLNRTFKFASIRSEIFEVENDLRFSHSPRVCI